MAPNADPPISNQRRSPLLSQPETNTSDTNRPGGRAATLPPGPAHHPARCLVSLISRRRSAGPKRIDTDRQFSEPRLAGSASLSGEPSANQLSRSIIQRWRFARAHERSENKQRQQTELTGRARESVMYVMRTGVCVWTGARVKRRGVASSNKQKRQSQSKLRFKPPAGGGEPLLTTTAGPPIWPAGAEKPPRIPSAVALAFLFRLLASHTPSHVPGPLSRLRDWCSWRCVCLTPRLNQPVWGIMHMLFVPGNMAF
jgi:hypothetical protein